MFLVRDLRDLKEVLIFSIITTFPLNRLFSLCLSSANPLNFLSLKHKVLLVLTGKIFTNRRRIRVGVRVLFLDLFTDRFYVCFLRVVSYYFVDVGSKCFPHSFIVAGHHSLKGFFEWTQGCLLGVSFALDESDCFMDSC